MSGPNTWALNVNLFEKNNNKKKQKRIFADEIKDHNMRCVEGCIVSHQNSYIEVLTSPTSQNMNLLGNICVADAVSWNEVTLEKGGL